MLRYRPAVGDKGTVWQYTAIDVASAYTWATLQVTRRNPSATWTSQLARQVAADLATRGWTLERVMSDNASEFRATVFGQAIAGLGPVIASSAPAAPRSTAHKWRSSRTNPKVSRLSCPRVVATYQRFLCHSLAFPRTASGVRPRVQRPVWARSVL